MITRALIALTLPFTLFASGITAAQAEDVTSWELKTISFISQGSGISNNYRNKVIPIEVLRSKGSADGVGDVAFVCGYGDLNFRIQVEPGDIYQTIRTNLRDTYEKKSNPRRTFRPKIQIAGEEAEKAKWIEGKRDQLVMPLEFKTTAQLYNATIRGQEVRFARKKKVMILNLPKPNYDFKEFGESCLRRK